MHVSKHTVAVTVGEIKNVLEEYGSWISCQPRFGYRLEIPKSEDLIRRGWHFWNQYTKAGFDNALRCFEQAAAHDSADFRAFEGIANTHLMLVSFIMGSPRDTHRAFLDAHHRTAELIGLTPELRMDLAYGWFAFEHRLEEAEAEFRELLREKPHWPIASIRLAMVSFSLGKVDEASALIADAQASGAILPPLAFIGTLLRLFNRQFEAAVEWGKETLDLHASSQIGRAHYADALDFAGRGEEAIAQYQLARAMSPDTTWIRAAEGHCLARNSRADEATAILDELRRRRDTQYVDAYLIALLLDALGRRDEAFAELERARDEKAYALLFAAVDSKADGLRSDPRFSRLGLHAAGRATMV